MQLCYVDRVVHCDRPVPRYFPTMKDWTSELLEMRDIAEIHDGRFALGLRTERYKRNMDQQTTVEKYPDVEESGLGPSQPTLQVEIVKDVIKYIKHMNDDRNKLVQTLKEASSQIKELDCFKMVCDIARCAIGFKPASHTSLENKVVLMSQSLHQEASDAYNELNDVYEPILKLTTIGKFLKT